VGMAGRGALSFAARSGRGGTTGRAAGWPARVRAEPGAVPAPVGGAGDVGGMTARLVSMGRDGRGITAGRAGELIALGAPGRRASVGAAGKGCRGPDKIWPGRGASAEPEVGSGFAAAGTGLPGTNAPDGGACGAGLAPGAPGAPKGGCTGRPVPSGGRMGAALRDSSTGYRSSAAAGGGGVAITGRGAAGALAGSNAASTGASSSVSTDVAAISSSSGTFCP
jgi:hypothetical protein